jgi:hypothetical protein
VTRNATSAGELPLDGIAARTFCSGAAAFPHYDPERPPAGAADLPAFTGDGPGHIVAALHAAGALPPASPVPGQLAGLCTRTGIPGHGITAPTAADLPEPWHSMLTRRPLRLPQETPTPAILAATVAGLPELDSAQITIFGMNHSERTIVHTLVSGVTAEGDWTYGRVVRPLPAPWVRDGSGRWHATHTNDAGPSGTAARSSCGSRSCPCWTAASPGSIWPPPGDRPRSGSGCRSAGRETLNSDPRGSRR